MTWKQSLVLALAVIGSCCLGAKNDSRKVHRMLLKRSSNDQENSATGYIYRQDGHGPPTIVYLNAGQVAGHFAGNPLPYSHTNGLGAKSFVVSNSNPSGPNGNYQHHSSSAYTKYPALNNYNPRPTAQAYVQPQELRPLVHVPHAVPYAPVAYKPSYAAPYAVPVKVAVPVYVKQQVKQEPVVALAAYKSGEDGGSGSSEESVESIESNHDDDDSGSHENYGEDLRRYGSGGFDGGDVGDYGHHGGSAAYTHHDHDDAGHHDSKFNKQGGSEYGAEHFKKHGEKGNLDYDSEHKYSKGDKGSHNKEYHEGHYDQTGGKKASHYDQADHQGEHHKSEKGSKGGKFGEKKQHKKGSKTTGYHNVFHKDEYKKDHTFYDDADHKGHFTKYGGDRQQYKGDEVEHANGAHHESAHHENHHGKKGKTEKGHHDSADKGYKKNNGYETHHQHDEDYGKKGGAEYGNEHKYAKAGGHGGH